MLLPFTRVVKANPGDSPTTTVVSMNPSFFTKSANESCHSNQASHREFVPRQMLEDAINKLHHELDSPGDAKAQQKVVSRSYYGMQIAEPAATVVCVTLHGWEGLYDVALEAEGGFTFATLVLEILRHWVQRTGSLDESTEVTVEAIEVCSVLRCDGSRNRYPAGYPLAVDGAFRGVATPSG